MNDGESSRERGAGGDLKEWIMRRRAVLSLGGFLCLAAAIFTSLWFATRPAIGINANSCDQIKRGMTRADVEVLFGAPAGDYSTRAETYRHPIRPSRDPRSEKAHPSYWISDDVFIALYFDDDDCVDGWSMAASHQSDEGLWAKVRRRLRLWP